MATSDFSQPVRYLAVAGMAELDLDKAAALAVGVLQVAAVAEEIRDPGRNIPRGILFSLGLAAGIYTLVVAVLVGIIPVAELGEDLRPVYSLATRRAASPGGQKPKRSSTNKGSGEKAS